MRKFSDCVPAKGLLASASIAAAIAGPAIAYGQETAQPAASQADSSSAGDIIVTAQRRAERLQTVPIAITALSADAIADQGITNLRNIATAVPNLNVAAYPTSSDTLTMTMRGQGAGDVGQITRDGGVSVYLDGFYIGRPQGALIDLGEPERIEVLRGPQGTLYGRNTTGGAVNIITKKPTGEWGGAASFTYGSRNLVRSLASIDLAAIGNLAIRGSIVYANQDGWVKNPGKPHDFGEFNQVAGRIAAKWTPNDTLSVLYSFDRGRTATTPFYYITPSLVGAVPGFTGDRDRTYKPIEIQPSISNFVDHQLTIEHELSDSMTVRSLTGYRGFRSNVKSNFDVAFSTPAFPFTFAADEYYRLRQYTQEFQFVGDLTNRLDYTAGLFYYREKGSHDKYITIDLGAFGTTSSAQLVDTLSISYAAYLQSTWNPPVFDDKLKLTAGGRYTRDKRTATRDLRRGAANEVGVSNELKFSNFSPMVNLAVQWTPDIMSYAKFSQGYKAGGSAEGSRNFTLTFAPEKVTAFEAGIKAQMFDRMLTLNLTGFYNKFDDIQLDITEDASDPSIGGTYNAGKATIKGIEFESTLQPTRDITLRGSFGYLKQNVKYVAVIPGSIFDGPYARDENIAGLFVLPFVPKYAWSVGGDWTFLRAGDDELSVHGTYSYQSRVYASAASGPDVVGRNFNRNDRVKNLDARIKWMHPIPGGKAITAALFAENLLNNRRSDFVTGVGGGLAGFSASALPYNEPRTIGGELKVEF